ncbi:hypothetical protein PU629_19335 [Pullulanibacillus sp. KACC 23026]|uniref:hypothetical protein n=1 Tax=Pullulanibacillus sp. KACC 23026 TaxID=3028315 RepID=UPI0023B168C0|nr:hypothetical protein [Pullulanibacillus sp. KACC 23026]WEG12247.1 hypothetical protein PU629_19335 [Pullulanibacillus sp. KACC 23026]
MKENPSFIWIEAEHWEEQNRNEEDGNTDVKVNFEDGTEWIATFFTYRNILTLSEKEMNKQLSV